jgi:DhnA family fructose-bisphosphate aldolase class Ia
MFMNTKMYRLREFANPADGCSLIVDASAGLALGALPGLQDFSAAVGPLLSSVDGLVASPGQATKLAGRTRQDTALLIRADWTNALRGPEFVLPPETTSYVPLLSPQDALDLGANALVLHFLLGYEEHIEAQCLRTTVQLAIAGSQVGMPLLVDVQPSGPRVALRDKAIELGVSYALEGGADGVAVPWPGRASFETIRTMAAERPLWIKPGALQDIESELAGALEPGAVGLWFNADLFAQPNPAATLQNFAAREEEA